MPVFALTDELVFPDPSQAEPDGLLALGGDLRPERLLLAYAHGIFPWNGEDEPLLWWSPAPRAVLAPGEIEVPRSLAKAIRRRPYRVTLDRAFAAVVAGCAETPRPGQDRTWITQAIRRAFVELHRRGLAHSVEAWDGERLVGGLYGLALGAVFCGESMFARADDASKIAFVALAAQLRRWGFTMIDCQVETAHLRRFGARPIARPEFMRRLTAAIERPWRIGVWSLDADLAGRADGGPPPRPAPPPVLWKMTRETGDTVGEERGFAVKTGDGEGEADEAAGADDMAVETGDAEEGEAAGADDMALETGDPEADADAPTDEAGEAAADDMALETGDSEADAGAPTGEAGEAAADDMALETGDSEADAGGPARVTGGTAGRDGDDPGRVAMGDPRDMSERSCDDGASSPDRGAADEGSDGGRGGAS